MSSQQSYLVIGGCGFLGRHLVEALLARGELQVAVFDLVQRHFDTNIQFFTGDITDEVAVKNAIQKTQATTIFHTASPVTGLPQELYQRVNVEGTKTVLAASVALGVTYFIYTSSAGLVFDGQHLIDADERLPPPEKPMDAYNHTKGVAERMVIEANGKEGMRTVALRPSGIFGPGDRQTVRVIANTVERGQTKFQVGSNNNLVDWTYVGNVVKAHLLAADKLLSSKVAPREKLLEGPVAPISCTTAERRIPTSLARPVGPAVIRPPNAAELEAAFALPRRTERRAFVRSKYDPLGAPALARETEDPLQVAGQVFNITNGEPVYFWDPLRSLMLGLGAPKRNLEHGKWVLPQPVGYLFAWAAEWVYWARGVDPTFTQERVTYMCASRYYNIEKARRVLGYEPDVGLAEGIQRSVEWWRSTHNSKESKR
ncbi:C-3 sterol dehydrogenase [Gautieria morchelliformis]|nr:C-3 sterol dehydrogenase [Gautieria morchelliformis]